MSSLVWDWVQLGDRASSPYSASGASMMSSWVKLEMGARWEQGGNATVRTDPSRHALPHLGHSCHRKSQRQIPAECQDTVLPAWFVEFAVH